MLHQIKGVKFRVTIGNLPASEKQIDTDLLKMEMAINEKSKLRFHLDTNSVPITKGKNFVVAFTLVVSEEQSAHKILNQVQAAMDITRLKFPNYDMEYEEIKEAIFIIENEVNKW